MKHFNKTTKNMTLTQKFDYIKNHFTYMNNGVANNIKIHKLPLTREQIDKAYDILGDENLYDELWDYYLKIYIKDFEEEYNNFNIYTSGRSGGYLVLTGKKGYKVINEDFENSETYKELVNNFKDWYNWTYSEAQKEARQEIEDTFDLIVEFDNLCDSMLAEFIYVLDNVKIRTETYTKEIEYKTLCGEVI